MDSSSHDVGKIDVSDMKSNTRYTGKKQKKQKYSKNNNHTTRTRWIETCSETIHHIPANCLAPLMCVVTRIEIDEEPKNDLIAEMKKTVVQASSNNIICNGNISNIARTSSLLTQYANQKKLSSIKTQVKHSDVENERQKIFMPVKRHSSAIGPSKWLTQQKQMSKHNYYNHLPHGDNGDGVLNPYPKSSVPDKFWAQRKRLFSRYDMGVRIGGGHDEQCGDCSPEMWYSVTLESIANHIAQRMMNISLHQKKSKGSIISEPREQQKEIIILDLFCGCGGNSIAFARYNNNNAVTVRTDDKTDNHSVNYNTTCPSLRVRVVAVDNNLSRLKNAAHNASIYDVECGDIVFVHADAIDVLCHYSSGNRKPRNSDVHGCNSSSHHDKTGFNIGGTELLPNTIDGIFLSPPWGGMDYENKKFDVVASINVESIISERSNNTKLATTVTTNGGELLSLATEAVFDKRGHNRDGVVAYFLPRNIDGIALGLTAVASDVVGSFEMEQNVVSGKCKTVTAYFGQYDAS